MRLGFDSPNKLFSHYIIYSHFCISAHVNEVLYFFLPYRTGSYFTALDVECLHVLSIYDFHNSLIEITTVNRDNYEVFPHLRAHFNSGFYFKEVASSTLSFETCLEVLLGFLSFACPFE